MAKLLVNYEKLNENEKKEYEASLKMLYVLLGIATVLYYVLPFVFSMIRELGTLLIYLTIMNVYTAFCFIAGMIHAKKFGFGIFVPVAISIYFVPTTLIFYHNVSLSGWAVLYFVLCLFGELTGMLMLKRKKSRRQPIGLNRLINGRPEQKSGGKSKRKKK